MKPHKNLGVLIEAFSLIKDRFPDIRLVLAGVEPDRAFKKAAAEFFVFPSLYEGFGFPPLEAMARKKAVISSPGGSLRETLGDNALFFSPDSAEDLAEKITLFIENEGKKGDYETKGFDHCQRFRWGKTIGEYISVLIDK